MTFIQNNIQKFLERYPQEKELASLLSSLPPNPQKVLNPSAHLSLDAELKKSRMLIFLGLGDALCFKRLFPILKDQNFIFVIFERSLEVLAKLWSEGDWTEFLEHPRTFWFLGKKTSYTREFQEAFSNISLVNSIGACTFVKLPDEALESNLYDQLLDLFIEAGSQQIQNVAAFPEDAYRGMMNYVRNTSKIASIPRLEEFKDYYRGMSGIVVSAGPSLKFCLPLLKKLQKHALVVCVDAVYKLLLSQGIIPHFVTSMERAATCEFFEGTPLQSQSCLITLPLLQPESLEAFQGPQVFLPSVGNGHEFFYPEHKGNDIGRSSATLAYAALALLGCDSIYLMGQDLAFDRFSEASHVSGVWNLVREEGECIHQKLKQEKIENNPNWIEGNNGQPILSRDCWKSFKEDFVRLGQKYSCKTFNIIPRDYGAKIPGVSQIEPEEALLHFDLSQDAWAKDIVPLLQIPLEQKKKKEAETTETMQRAISFFDETFVPTILEMNQALSLYYQYNFPMVNGEELEKKYESLFNELEKAENLLLKKDSLVVNGLMLPFFQYLMPVMCIEISKVRNEPIPYVEKVQQIVNKLFGHYKDLLYWGMRVNDLLKRRLSGNI
ncbi:MAG: motility associated factor glycosyltransferase family protein [Deltaproteobacteria bacterium]|nr:motility associated factor glycosyltransferase family protein [Deltaproteobacteria bacterium]